MIYKAEALLIVISLLCATPYKAWGDQNMNTAAYGTKTKFKKGIPLHFPDFQLVYLGKRSQDHANGRQSIYEDFEMTQGQQKISVSYVHGWPGDIGPGAFTLNGREFFIEMIMTELIKGPEAKLKKDELILTPAKDYQDYENRRRMQTNSKRNAFANYKSDPPEDKKLISVKEIRKHIIPEKTTRHEVDKYLDRLTQEGYWIQPLSNPHIGQIQFKTQEGWVSIETGFEPQSKVTEITGGDQGTQP